MKYLFVFLTLFSFAFAQSSPHIVPRWIAGAWEGNVGNEHDTSSYLTRITIDSNSIHNTIELKSMKLKYDLVLDSIGTNFCRFKIIDSLNIKLKFIQQATIDLIRAKDWPKDILHFQMYTKNHQLWIGQLKKQEID